MLGIFIIYFLFKVYHFLDKNKICRWVEFLQNVNEPIIINRNYQF